jgi:methylthioribulose 1-phosphate dehydratase/enolase-phosphatase E1
MTPSGVQKERIQPDELFVLGIHDTIKENVSFNSRLSDKAGNILSVPQQKSNNIAPKLSDCSPLFLHAFQQRNAGKL